MGVLCQISEIERAHTGGVGTLQQDELLGFRVPDQAGDVVEIAEGQVLDHVRLDGAALEDEEITGICLFQKLTQ